jgi:hypothetical protein
MRPSPFLSHSVMMSRTVDPRLALLPSTAKNNTQKHVSTETLIDTKNIFQVRTYLFDLIRIQETITVNINCIESLLDLSCVNSKLASNVSGLKFFNIDFATL